MKIRIASRGSELALWQTNHIKNLLEQNGHEVEIIVMKTKGDVILDTPLAKIGGKGLFTKELENAMLENRADIAVHSLKDVPTKFEAGLKLAAVCSRADTNDTMLSMKYAKFSDLPQNAKVGTTSLRRQMQLLMKRPDLNLISLRGNVNSRINKLKNGEFDAIILAQAGIDRLGLDKLVNFTDPLDTICAMGQGALGIEARSDDEAILKAIDFLNDEKSVIETRVERDFVDTLNGGCQAPIGIRAELKGDKIEVSGILGLPDGSEFLKEVKIYQKSHYQNAGREFAKIFLDKNAANLLSRAEIMANSH
nr:hydroxymethylbilane synthase [Campylobacter sp.]